MNRSARALALVTSTLLACGSAGAPKPAEPSPPPPPMAEVAPPAPVIDPMVARFNLSFEQGDPPDGWRIFGPHKAAVADAAQVHAGAHSLRIDADGSGNAFSAFSRVLPIEEVRGKQVRVAAWFKTDALGGELGLWLRADQASATQPIAFGGTHAQPVTGTSDWVRREATLVIPTEAEAFVFGAFVSGRGTAWIDDLTVTIEDEPTAVPVAVRGHVRDAAGAPVAGAVVAAVQPRRATPSTTATTAADGGFAIDVAPGDWAFTATSALGVAAYAEVRAITTAAEVDLALGERGVTVTGRVQVVGTPTAPLQVQAVRLSQVEGDIFVGEVAADGRYRLRLPPADGYLLSVTGGGAIVDPVNIGGDVDRTVELVATVPGPAPDDVVTWLRATTARLAATEPGHGTDDLRPLSKIVAGARVIALGEATHGTREFFQLKHRVLEYLVEREGVRWFAIEANQPEARKVDEYILTGKGSAAEALAGMYFWTWNTEEVLAMIEWMRAYNADPRHKDKLRFAGFDMQTTTVAWASVMTYLGQVDPAFAAEHADLALFGAADASVTFGHLPADERKAARAHLAALLARFDHERGAWSKRTSADAWAIARQDARVVEQAAAMFDAGTGEFDARDRAMAENVDWLLARAGKKAKIMLWAHNAHVARELTGMVNMGSHLATTYGKAYRPIGFAFADGGFQAVGMGAGSRGLAAFTLGPPAEGDVSIAFTRAGIDLGLVDLRAAPAPVAAWLAAPHPMRELGAVFVDEAGTSSAQRLSRRFDALLFVAHTTRARPNPPRTR